MVYLYGVGAVKVTGSKLDYADTPITEKFSLGKVKVRLTDGKLGGGERV